MRFSLASWNIGGGILGASHQYGGKVEIEYYAQLLSEVQAQWPCLKLI